MFATPRSAARAKLLIGNLPLPGHRFKRGVIELTFLTFLYVGYSASRLLASNDFPAARGRALELLNFEKAWRIDYEKPLNDLFARNDILGLFGSFWYATTHYFVTAAVLIWLYRRSASQYVTARRALVVATIIGLAFYLSLPTAPPRLINGAYIDILSQHAQAGWWGADASAPRGLGGMTNELAALPSLHAGWALWIAFVFVRAGLPRIVQYLGFLYAATMAFVIVGTANHWVLDVVVGWLVVIVGLALVLAWEKRSPVIAHEERARIPKVAAQLGIPRLRRWAFEDASTVLEAFAADDLAQQRDTLIETIDDARRWIKGTLDDHASGSGYNWAIETDGDVVGSVSVATIDTDRRTGSVSYWTLPSFRGRANASAGLRLLADWCFDELGLFRLELGHRANNTESCRVALQAGFKVEGHERERLNVGYGRSDVEVHARLRTD